MTSMTLNGSDRSFLAKYWTPTASTSEPMARETVQARHSYCALQQAEFQALQPPSLLPLHEPAKISRICCFLTTTPT